MLERENSLMGSPTVARPRPHRSSRPASAGSSAPPRPRATGSAPGRPSASNGAPRTSGSSRSPRASRRWLAGTAAFNALAAWGGAVALATGGIDFGDVINDRLPFGSLVLAGVALATIVALPLTVLAWAAWTGAAKADDIALAAGVLLCGWIVVQVVVLRAFSLFQPLYLVVGVFFIAASHRVRLGRGWRGVLVVAIGAVVAAVGVGLLPHLIRTGLSVASVVSVVSLAAGIACLVEGARSALSDRHLAVKVTGCAAGVIAVAVSVAAISPAVAATHVRSTEVGMTPAGVGLAHESVTLTTDDGVQLASWYVPGTLGAGVVVLHGAGSTRSDVLDRSAVLVAAGYAVLLVDARGHGDSHGTAMDFGWYGDLDVAAATEFLASRPEIDPARIGVVGFSMGGEQAIGAAASDPNVRAVVAEGATARRAADKEWLSDAYGWRGWVQERLEYLQDGVTDFLTEASPPLTLRAAVADAPDTRFLLITAGTVSDEGRAASYIRSAASDRVTVWTVDGADHTGGYESRPDEWRARVVAFLDENLR
jgi:uncharacterized protein